MRIFETLIDPLLGFPCLKTIYGHNRIYFQFLSAASLMHKVKRKAILKKPFQPFKVCGKIISKNNLIMDDK
jgi:hypothetical protein